MNKNILATILFLVLVAIGGTFLVKSGSNSKNSIDTSTTQNIAENNPQVSEKGVSTVANYSLAEVAKHNSVNSCWTAVGGRVYDLTSFVSKHPGGDKNILKICGKDGTSAFEGQHGGDSKPNNVLSSFFLGNLN